MKGPRHEHLRKGLPPEYIPTPEANKLHGKGTRAVVVKVTQRVHVYYHYGIRSPKPVRDFRFGGSPRKGFEFN